MDLFDDQEELKWNNSHINDKLVSEKIAFGGGGKPWKTDCVGWTAERPVLKMAWK